MRALVLALALVAAAPAWAQVAIPALAARVTDLTATLSAEQKGSLEQKLAAFEAKKGSQIAILLVPTTAGEPIEQYAIRVAEQWKIGRKKLDDGALLIVAKDDRAVRIEVGYGLEGALSDIAARRIVGDVIVPRFRAGDFHGGLSEGVERMIRVIDGEQLPAPAARQGAGGAAQQSLPVLLVAAVFAGLALRAILGRFLGSLAAGGAVGWLAWALAGTLAIGMLAGILTFLFSLVGGMGGRRRGGLGYGGGWGTGGGMRGGWGGGFGGGGGFRGGGGSFGGGGASGRW